MWQSFRVGAARKTADVPYPHMYATVEECKADKKKLVCLDLKSSTKITAD